MIWGWAELGWKWAQTGQLHARFSGYDYGE